MMSTTFPTSPGTALQSRCGGACVAAVRSRAASRAAVEPLEGRRLLAADIEVLGPDNVQVIADGDATPAEADGTDLGSVALGVAGPTRTFTIRNSGDQEFS